MSYSYYIRSAERFIDNPANIKFAEIDRLDRIAAEDAEASEYKYRVVIFEQDGECASVLEIAECNNVAWCNELFEDHNVTHVRTRDEGLYEPEFLTVAEELEAIALSQKDLFTA